MATTALHPATDEAFIATLAARLPGCTNLIAQSNAFVSYFFRSGRRIPLPGSHTLYTEVEKNESSSMKWFDGLDPLDYDYDPGSVLLEYGHHFGSIPLPGTMTDRLRNRDGVVHDIDMKRFNHVIRTLQNRIAYYTLNGNGGKEPLGFLNAIEAAAIGSQSATVGGVAKATNHWWNNQYVTSEAATNFGDAVGTGMSAGVLAIIKLILACRRGALFPTAVFVNSSIYQNVLRSQAALFGLRTNDGIPSEVRGGIGQNITILGVPIMEESTLPANTGLCITTEANVVPFGGLTGGSEDQRTPLTPDDVRGCYIGYHRELDYVVTPKQQIAANVMGDISYVLVSQTHMFTNLLAQGRLNAGAGSSLDTY